MSPRRVLRVAVFNDSPTVRAAIRAALATAPDIAVVAEHERADDAAAVVEQSQADVVVMDVVMPGVDGYAATRAIMQRRPTPIVMVTAVLDPRDQEVIFAALEAGALHLAEPPPAPGSANYAVKCAGFTELLRTIAGARVRADSAIAEIPRPVPPAPEPGAIDAIGIVASAGGPQALIELLGALPRGLMPPILIVQHLAPGFIDSFARWLGDSGGHPVEIAADGIPARAGYLYVPPDDRHLALDGARRLVVSDAAPEGGFRPSGDFLLRSLAGHRSRALGVILSGMGRDGAEGARALEAAGGGVIAQRGAAIDGMPAAAMATGAVESSLPVAEIAQWLRARSAAA